MIECREALALPARPDRVVVLRRVIAQRDRARVEIVLNPRGSFGSDSLGTAAQGRRSGVWRGRIGALHMAWSGGERAVPRATAVAARRSACRSTSSEGEHHDFVLVLALGAGDVEPPDPGEAWSATEAAWRERVPKLEKTVGPRDARHAYAVLSGLTSASGGMVAAATMSLPERAREGRNFDYRYVWIRDQCYAGQAVAQAGPNGVLDDAVRFVGAALLEHGRGA